MSKLLVVLVPALLLSAQPQARPAPDRIAQTSADDAPAPSLNAKKAWFRSAVDAILSGEDGMVAPADAREKNSER